MHMSRLMTSYQALDAQLEEEVLPISDCADDLNSSARARWRSCAASLLWLCVSGEKMVDSQRKMSGKNRPPE